MENKYKLLSAKFLESKGFKLIESKPFDNFNMPYYVKDSVILFFNEPVTDWNKNSFLVGYGEMYDGKYFAVGFRWINNQEDLLEIYKSVTGNKIN